MKLVKKYRKLIKGLKGVWVEEHWLERQRLRVVFVMDRRFYHPVATLREPTPFMEDNLAALKSLKNSGLYT